MDQKAIKRALDDAGLNWNSAAKAIGVSPSHVIRVAARDVISRRVAIRLAAILGLGVTTVFPDRPDYAVDRRAEAEMREAAARQRLQSAGLASVANG